MYICVNTCMILDVLRGPIDKTSHVRTTTKASHKVVVQVGCDMLLDFNLHVNTLTFTYNPNVIQ